jgi:hypothetical protein
MLVIRFGDFLRFKLPDESSKLERRMGSGILLDGKGNAERPSLRWRCERTEAFTEAAWPGEEVDNWNELV